MNGIPDIPSDMSPDEAWRNEKAALDKLAIDERERIAKTEAFEAASKALGGNSDFRLFIQNYFGDDMKNKLRTLETCQADELVAARQRYVDAKRMYEDLMEIVDPPAAG